MIDRIFNRLGIGLALMFMVAELSYINYKSLVYLSGGSSMADMIFAVIGSMAFSVVTVVVMRKTNRPFMRLVFPVFDTALVFCGFNLEHAQEIINGTDNPIRFMLTIFMAVFTGFIVYGLGVINYKEQTESVNKRDQDRISELIRKADDYNNRLNKAKTEAESLKSEVELREGKIKSLESELKTVQSKLEAIRSEFNGKESELMKYKTIYMHAERSRILKKKPENRLPEEMRLLETSSG